MIARTWFALALALTLTACGSGGGAEAPPAPPAASADGAAPGPDAGGGAGDPDAASQDDDAPGSQQGPIGPAGSFSKSLTVDGVLRSYRLYVPASATAAMQNGGVPVLVGLHGAGDTADNFLAATFLEQAADQNAFVLLGPNAFDGGGGGAWFLHDNEGWPGTDGTTNSLRNDLRFVAQMLADTAAAYRVDPKREFACGFSRGAGFTGGWAIMSNNARFTQLSGLSVSSPFAAYAVSAGFDMFGGQVDASKASPKRPLWIMHGTSDQAVPFSQGQGLASSLSSAGFSATFTSVSGAPHAWLWRSQYGHSNQELWDWMMKNPLP